MHEQPRTRKDFLQAVKEYVKEIKKTGKINKLSKSKAEELFIEYFSDNDLFVLYEHSYGYILIYSEIYCDSVIYNILLTSHDTDDIEYELDFDDLESLQRYVVNELHLSL